jgi:hypothetical protein
MPIIGKEQKKDGVTGIVTSPDIILTDAEYVIYLENKKQEKKKRFKAICKEILKNSDDVMDRIMKDDFMATNGIITNGQKKWNNDKRLLYFQWVKLMIDLKGSDIDTIPDDQIYKENTALFPVCPLVLNGN